MSNFAWSNNHVLTHKQHIVIHTMLILCYLASMSIEPSNTISLILRVISGLLISFYIVGESLKSALKKHFAFPQSTPGGGVSFNLLLSLSYFMCVSIILSLQYSLNSINLAVAMILVIAVSDIAGLKPSKSRNLEIERKEEKFRTLWPIIPIFVFGLLLALVFRSSFSWPSMPGWDVYTHLGVSNWIVTHHGTTNIMPSSLGSFIPYPYLFHILVSSTAFLIGVDPYLIFWVAPFFTIPIYGLLVYGVSNSLTQQREHSFVAALIAVTICGGESFLGPHYFFPSTMSFLLFLLLLIVILGFPCKGRVPMTLICGFVLLYYTFYYYPLIVTFPILLFFLMRNKHQHSKPILIFSLIGMILISGLVGSIFFSGQNLSLAKKLEMIRWVYPDLLWLLFLLGALIIMAKHFSGSSKERNLLMVLAYTMSLLIVYFLPPLALRRTEIIFRSFFAIIASFSFLWIQHSFASLTKVREHLKKLPSFFSYIILVFSILLLIQPYLSYANNVPRWSNISMDEYLAAEWIKQNSLPDSYILTDPSTGYVLRGLTLRNSSTSFIIHGHTPSPESGPGANLSKLIYDFFREEDPLKVPDYLEKFPKLPELIVVTTRTSSWVRWGTVNTTFCAPTAEKLMPFPGMDKFSTPFFALLKSWETVEIYRPSKGEIVPVWIDNSFTEGWSWYLDGAYKDYSSTTYGNSVKITVQAKSTENAWMGLTKQIPNCTDATYLQIRYKIDVPCYVLEPVLWDSNGDYLMIRYLPQWQEWSEETLILTEEEASKVAKVGLIMWTNDTLTHTFEIDYILLGKIEAMP